MAVRNFWINCEIDGRQNDLSGGPRAKDGCMYIKIYQREDGCIANKGLPMLYVYCTEENGVLHLDVNDANGQKIHSIITRR